MTTLLKVCIEKVNCFEAGRISQCINQWRQITSDPERFDVVSGYDIELIEGSPLTIISQIMSSVCLMKRLFILNYLSLLLNV